MFTVLHPRQALSPQTMLPSLLLAACTTSPRSAQAPLPPPVPELVAPPQAPALPGPAPRIGFAARPTAGVHIETPRDPTAEVVLQVNPGDWASIPLGTPVLGHGATGTVSLTYAGLTKLRLGCDGGWEGDWARFDAPTPLPEGPILIEPAGGVAYQPESVLPGGSRSWTLGALGVFVVTTPDPNVARVTITPEAGAPVSHDFRKSLVQGYDGTAAYNLDNPDELFIPTPLAALRAHDGSGRVLTRWQSFEGTHYEVYGLGKESMREGETYLYWCAF